MKMKSWKAHKLIRRYASSTRIKTSRGYVALIPDKDLLWEGISLSRSSVMLTDPDFSTAIIELHGQLHESKDSGKTIDALFCEINGIQSIQRFIQQSFHKPE